MKFKTPKLLKAIFGTYILLSAFAIVIVIALFVVGGYWRNFLQGPKEVLAKVSPDQTHKAFVSNTPSIDGPNHTMYIESADKKKFYKVSLLEEDMDFIKDIIWSDDSRQVVFLSKDYITLVDVDNLSIKKTYLGDWWEREGEGKRTTFKAGKSKDVEWVGFDEGKLDYQLRN